MAVAAKERPSLIASEESLGDRASLVRACKLLLRIAGTRSPEMDHPAGTAPEAVPVHQAPPTPRWPTTE